jgi:hypothetical protein
VGAAASSTFQFTVNPTPSETAVASPPTNGWTWNLDCEKGTPGAQVAQTGWENFSKTVYSTAQAATGTQSCQMGIRAGSSGWGEWGGIVHLPTKLKSGDQIWMRLSLFVPAGFDLTVTSNNAIKYLRLHTATASGAHVGYHDLQLVSNVKTPSAPPMQYLFEGAAASGFIGIGTNQANGIAFGRWETYEWSIKFDAVAKSKGGTGETWVWKNNQLLLDRTDQPTLASATDVVDEAYLFTWWNEVAPATQSLYVDDVSLSSAKPATTDAGGRPCLCGPTPR